MLQSTSTSLSATSAALEIATTGRELLVSDSVDLPDWALYAGIGGGVLVLFLAIAAVVVVMRRKGKAKPQDPARGPQAPAGAGSKSQIYGTVVSSELHDVMYSVLPPTEPVEPGIYDATTLLTLAAAAAAAEPRYEAPDSPMS
jgi:hypothetical protein